jgi:tRNA (mo5U34)-methyltransferase
MANEFVFDKEHAQRFNERRMKMLDRLIPWLVREKRLESCLDAGCGIGFFSDYLSRSGLSTVAFDGREENIAEARRRFPGIEFHVNDVESDEVEKLGKFDLVLCFGLLYHLENPLRAIRNLESMTQKVLILESMITPVSKPVATLVDEGIENDLSLRCVAFVPSESCIVKMLYYAGFKRVYRIVALPDHEDFRARPTQHRRRCLLVASRDDLYSTMLAPVWDRPISDLWTTRLSRMNTFALRLMRKVRKILRRP